MRRSKRIFLVGAAALWLLAGAAGAVSPEEDTVASSDSQQEARSLLMAMAEYLAGQDAFSVKLLAGYDDRILLKGSVWETMRGTPAENVRKVVLVVVNAETQPDTQWDRSEAMPPVSAMMSSYSSIAIERYNEENIALVKENAKSWAEEIRDQRCKGRDTSSATGSCGDIEFYVVEVKFDALEDETERIYFKRLPTSFSLKSEQVDQLREAAHRILVQSEEFQRFLQDLKRS